MKIEMALIDKIDISRYVEVPSPLLPLHLLHNPATPSLPSRPSPCSYGMDRGVTAHGGGGSSGSVDPRRKNKIPKRKVVHDRRQEAFVAHISIHLYSKREKEEIMLIIHVFKTSVLYRQTD